MMFNTELDSILKAFTKIDAKLAKFIDVAEAEHDALSANLVEIENKRLAIINEKARARKVRSNIQGLLGV